MRLAYGMVAAVGDFYHIEIQRNVRSECHIGNIVPPPCLLPVSIEGGQGSWSHCSLICNIQAVLISG